MLELLLTAYRITHTGTYSSTLCVYKSTLNMKQKKNRKIGGGINEIQCLYITENKVNLDGFNCSFIYMSACSSENN